MRNKHNMRVVLLLIFVLLATSLTGCGQKNQSNSGGKNENSIVLKASHVLQEEHPYHDGFLKMKEIVEQKTNGEVQIEVFANAVLGEETESVEKMIKGTIDMATLSPSGMTTLVKEYYACDLPFNFRNEEEARAFYDGEIGDILFEKTEEIGLVGLAWWEYGFRNVCNGKVPVRTPEDMKGLKIRIQNSPVHIATMKALGANPVPLGFSEVYTSLQQGVIDGWETPPIAILTGRYYEVQDYYSLTGHFYDPSPVYISKKTWDKLTPEQQEILKEAAIEARDYMRELISEQTDKAIEEIKEKGMEVIEINEEEYKAFQEATKDVYKEFENEIGKEFLDNFLKTLANNATYIIMCKWIKLNDLFKEVGYMEQSTSSNNTSKLKRNEKSNRGVLIRIFENAEMYICIICLFAMTVITFMQVIGRYVFNYSFSWSEEISRFLLAWITFAGASYAFRYGAHIGVTYFIDKLSADKRKKVYVLIQIITIGFFAVLGILGLMHTVSQVRLNQIAPATKISIGVPYSSIPIGCLLVVIRIIVETVEKAKPYNREVKD